MLPLRGLAREALWDTVVISGLAFVEEEMEAERAALCGPRYAHLAERQAQRNAGVAPVSWSVFGRKGKEESDAENTSTIRGRVSAADGRTGARGTIAEGVGAGVRPVGREHSAVGQTGTTRCGRAQRRTYQQ